MATALTVLTVHLKPPDLSWSCRVISCLRTHKFVSLSFRNGPSLPLSFYMPKPYFLLIPHFTQHFPGASCLILSWPLYFFYGTQSTWDLASLLNDQVPENRNCMFNLWLSPQSLVQCLGLVKASLNIYWINKEWN